MLTEEPAAEDTTAEEPAADEDTAAEDATQQEGGDGPAGEGAAEPASEACGFCPGGVDPDAAGAEVPGSGGSTCADLAAFAGGIGPGGDCDAVVLAEPLCCPEGGGGDESSRTEVQDPRPPSRRQTYPLREINEGSFALSGSGLDHRSTEPGARPQQFGRAAAEKRGACGDFARMHKVCFTLTSETSARPPTGRFPSAKSATTGTISYPVLGTEFGPKTGGVVGLGCPTGLGKPGGLFDPVGVPAYLVKAEGKTC
ncbi:hypothetical protein THAOC_22745 [Thalassiosira oceanica]|uniref:Uncharacterized protein n=1 Tax=Thalassiosira oceanica TaxID=159749 RepID=K0RTT6_THAOC|nr:hypothetical protein THAOC_22745 [Thalassiosira oceanica]|eukprot:EJK57238.1 hypothetical protein THAOC_22745 [Thalassiosira oceanica]